MRIFFYFLAGIVLVGIAIGMALRASDNARALETFISWEEQQLEKARTVDSRRDEFTVESRQLDAQLASLRQNIPVDLSLNSFGFQLEDNLRSNRIPILSCRYSEGVTSGTNSGMITIVALSDPRTISSYLSKMKPGRFVRYSAVRDNGRTQEFDVEVFSIPGFENLGEGPSCETSLADAMHGSIPTPQVMRLKNQASAKCAEINAHLDSIRMVDELETKRDHLMILSETIESLRPKTN